MIVHEKDKPKSSIPAAFKDRYVIRCIEEEFGISKKGNPMITQEWEICGYQNGEGTLQEVIKRGKTEYMIAGRSGLYKYFALVPGFPVQQYFETREKLGLPVSDIDEENPTLDMKGIVANAILDAEQVIQRKALTEEERDALKEEGKPVIGDPILDDSGHPIVHYKVTIQQFLSRSNLEIANRPF